MVKPQSTAATEYINMLMVGIQERIQENRNNRANPIMK